MTNTVSSQATGTRITQLTEPVARRTRLSATVGHTLLIPATIYSKNTLMVVDTAAQMSMISQLFADSLGSASATSHEQIRIKNAEHGSHTKCRLSRQLPITIQRKQFSIDVAVGPVTDNFIIGLDLSLCC